MSEARSRLEALRAAHPDPRHSIAAQNKAAETASSFLEEFRVNFDPKELEFDYTLHLLERLRAGLPDHLLALIDAGRITVGEVHSPAANAHLSHMSDGSYLVVFNSGLRDFLYRVARALVTSVIAVGSAQPTLTQVELARVIAECFWWYQETGAAFGPDYPASWQHISMASELSVAAESLLLAHEFYHVLFAEMNPDARFSTPSEELFCDVNAAVSVVAATAANRTPDDQTVGSRLMLAVAGIEFAFQVWSLMAAMGMEFVDGPHPPPSIRIDSVRLAVRAALDDDGSYDQLYTVADHIRSTFDHVAVIVTTPGTHHEYFAERAAELVASMDELVQRCTQSAVPDYVTFLNEAPRLLDQGYTETMLNDVVGRIAANWRAAQLELTRGSGDLARHMRAFGAYKLFLSLAENLEGAVSPLIQNVLRSAAGQ